MRRPIVETPYWVRRNQLVAVANLEMEGSVAVLTAVAGAADARTRRRGRWVLQPPAAAGSWSLGTQEINIELLLRYRLVVHALEDILHRVVGERVRGSVVAAGAQFKKEFVGLAVP